MPSISSERFQKAIAAFDAYHKKDPFQDSENGTTFPNELLYAQRMTERLQQYAADANESVQLAARCQHIGRWEIAREEFPMDKKGYFQWRNQEKMHHARIAENILTECGYDEQTILKVKSLLLKKELFTDPDAQLLEDVVCLVFIEFYLEPFTNKHDDEKVVDILRKTIKKMSQRGKETVKGLNLTPKIRSLIERALLLKA